jgi:hypothetical protein
MANNRTWHRPQVFSSALGLALGLVLGLAGAVDLAAQTSRQLYHQKLSLGPRGPQVDVRVEVDGRLTITNALGKPALTLTADDWAVLDLGTPDGWDDSALEFVDINFDGVADAKVLVARGAYNFVYAYYAWFPKSQQFVALAGLDEVSNPEFDARTKTLVSFHKVRGYGDLWVQREFRWTGKVWLGGDQTERQLVDEQNEDSGYVLIHRRLENGSWVDVSREPDN